ncbi:exodeoxyribonuclease III [Corynebacterium xerosis]|uniref:exodeoxyribonuclease III n=1 Tax=Corynebacterium xerosis TaxID=1725 RepID=UPI0006274B8E|nr:exodeoxyribonuclease III [Corynebacterium xerosis]KKO82712.1 exodeoxyribonuclease III [Corynebacterium xerosis]
MRICVWNVNSARTRLERMAGLLERHDVDVLAVQETKCRDHQFPAARFEELGYRVAHHGLNQWNGVAIISRVGLDDVVTGFPGQPGFTKDQKVEQLAEARHIAATCGGVRVHSVYVPNGREVGDPHYDYKLRFLEALRDAGKASLDDDPAHKAMIGGDFNIAPRDEDVWDMAFFEGKTHVTPPERAAFEALQEAGFRDVTREHTEDQWTYWDYQQLRFQKRQGMRIDFQLATPALAETVTGAFIDREERKGKGASDHAPVIVDYDV